MTTHTRETDPVIRAGSQEESKSRRWWRDSDDLAIGLLLGGFSLLLYWSTLTPGLAFSVDPFNPPGDTHEFTEAIVELRLARRTGYPLYTWLGYLFVSILPFGEPAYRTNLMSAVCGAAAVAMVFAVARRLRVGRAPAAFGALAFAMTTTFWSQAVITEVYTLNVLALSTFLWLLLGWAERRTPEAFATFALAYGISLGCHTSNLSFAAVIAIFVLYTDIGILKNGKALGLGVLAFLIGISQYVWLPLMADTAKFPNLAPDSLEGIYDYTIGAFSNLRFAYPIEKLPTRFMIYLSHLHRNFTAIGILLGMVGIAAFARRQAPAFWLLFGIFALNVLIAMQVYASDLEVFFLPSHVVWAVFLAMGAEACGRSLSSFFGRLGANRAAVARKVATAILATLLCSWALWVGSISHAANDRTDDTAFADFYEAVFSMLPKEAYLVPAGPGVFGQGAVYYQRALGQRPDLTLHVARERLKMPPQPVYSVMPLVNGRPRPPFSGSPVPRNAWFIPVLVGNHRHLILYRIDRQPPRLFLKRAPRLPGADAAPAGTSLERLSVRVVEEPPRPRLHLELQWHLLDYGSHTVFIKIDGVSLAPHPLGLGNLERYIREVRQPKPGDELVAESYDLVLPRFLQPGGHSLEIGVTSAADRRVKWFEPKWFSTQAKQVDRPPGSRESTQLETVPAPPGGG